MSAEVSGVGETTEATFVNREDLSHEEAAKLLNDALAKVNENLKQGGKTYAVIYNGQPHLGTKREEHPEKIDPTLPLDLALLHEGGKVEPIDIVDVVKFEGYDPKIGRLTTGFMAIEAFAEVITAKIDKHLESKQNPDVLISPLSGTKYNVEKLIGHTLAIDPLNYILLDGHRVVYYLEEEPNALSASSLRSSGVMQVEPHEVSDKLYLYESGDLAPRFYFDLSKLVQIAKEHFPAEQQKDVADVDGYYVLRRDAGKV
ncbi:hypothetical protein [Simkania sp.]|uniref:hypothetical protein n=1 Tax=Simkania sp. TaxID=34094 RepID=UPI003B5276DC